MSQSIPFENECPVATLYGFMQFSFRVNAETLSRDAMPQLLIQFAVPAGHYGHELLAGSELYD